VTPTSQGHSHQIVKEHKRMSPNISTSQWNLPGHIRFLKEAW